MTKMPLVSPESHSPKVPASAPDMKSENKKPDDRQRNLAEQGRQGNIKQNTTNQSYQQDR